MSAVTNYAAVPDLGVSDPRVWGTLRRRRQHLHAVPDWREAVRRPVAAAPGRPHREATVLALHPPRPARPPVRLTRRGLAAISCAVAALAAALVLLALASAPQAASSAPSPGSPGAVIVHSGDSLWSIAQRVAPNSDPRQVVAQLEQVNGLSGPGLVPGQVLRTR